MAFNQMLDMTHGMHPLQLGGIKNFRKVFAGGSEMFILFGGIVLLGGAIFWWEVTEF